MGGPVLLLLDAYTGAAAAYSLRKLKSDYTGKVLQVRRASDHVEVDVGFDSNGLLSLDSPVTNVTEESTGITQGSSTNAAKLGEFCGEARRGGGDTSYATVDSMTEASHVEVVTWYDQSGNTKNATQVAAASQPRIYDRSSGLIVENEKPALYFGGEHSIDFPGIGANVATVFGVHDNGGSTANKLGMFDYLDNSFINDRGTYMQFRPRGGSWSTTATSQIDFKSWYLLADGSSSEAAVNDQTPNAGSTNTISRVLFRLGRHNSSYFTGHFYELVIYPSDDDYRTGVNTNTNTFYSIY